MTDTTKRVRRRAALLAVLTIAASGCTGAEAPPLPAVACEVGLPAAWQEAFAGSGVATGGSTRPFVVSPAGEVAAVRDNGPTRDLLLIGPDGSVTTSYTVPSSDGADLGFTTMSDVTMDDRRIVVAVSRERGDSRAVIKDGQPYASTGGPGPTLSRVDVIDRRHGSVRTILTAADLRSRPESTQEMVLHGDTLFLQTGSLESSGVDRTLWSYDLATGTVAQVASGNIGGLRATTEGFAWFATDPKPLVRNLTAPPAALAGIPGIDEAQPTLVGDGNHYAWITGLAEGGTGIAWWSTDTGLHRLDIRRLPLRDGGSHHPPPVSVAWPYLVLGPRLTARGTSVLDTRSGAIANVDETVVGAGGGTIATQSRAPGVAPFAPDVTGLVRTDELPPLTC